MGDIQFFNRKMDFYLTASPSPFPCIKITWYDSIRDYKRDVTTGRSAEAGCSKLG